MVSTRTQQKDKRSRPDSPVPKEEDQILEPVDQDTANKPKHGLKRRNSSAIDDFRRQAQAKWILISSGSPMWNDDRSDTEFSFRLLTVAVTHWAMEYAASEPTDLDRLSEEQKVDIISSLEGSCAQDNWDSLLEKVPGIGFGNGLVVELFLTAMVFQDLYDKVIEHPFWYLDGKSCRDQAGDETFGERLEYLYGKFLETNPIMAEYWIREIVRLSNSISPAQAPDTTYGRYNQDRREAAAARLADDLLASGPVQSLLRAPADVKMEKKWRDELVEIYKRAGHAAVFSDQCSGQAKYLRLADLGPTYHASSDRLSISDYHISEDDRLDGHRILLVVRPAIFRKSTHVSPEFQTWLPAVVVVEDEKINTDPSN